MQQYIVLAAVAIGIGWSLNFLPTRDKSSVTAKSELLIYLNETGKIHGRMQYVSCGSATKEDVRATPDVKLSDTYLSMWDSLANDSRRIYIGTIASAIREDKTHFFNSRLVRLGLRPGSIVDDGCNDWIAAMKAPEVAFLLKGTPTPTSVVTIEEKPPARKPASKKKIKFPNGPKW